MLENQHAIGSNILMSTIRCFLVLFLREGATLRLVNISLQWAILVLPLALRCSAVSELKGWMELGSKALDYLFIG